MLKINIVVNKKHKSKIKKYGRVKDDDLVMYKGFDKFPFRNYYSYGHNNTGNHFDISLPCPMPSCKFSGFTNFFNGYDNDIKKILLTSNNTHDPVSKINYG